jgi:cytochrome c-type biogenesis protein
VESDPAAGVGIPIAFAAGAVSFLSPCVLPLVPGYLSAVTGVAVSELDEVGWRRVLVPCLLFITSFSLVFILLGLTATGIGDALRENRETLNDVAGVLIIAMGAVFVAAPFIPRLNREWRIEALMARTGSGGPVVAGAAFGIAWTPCIGPTLSAILAAAALSDSTAHGGFLLAVYSLGLGIPFLAAGLAFSRATTAFDAIKHHYAAIIAVGGAILIAMGILILTGEFFQLNIEAQKLLNELGINPAADV